MPEHTQIETCNRCHRELSGSYCVHCGGPRELRRINRGYILAEIGSFFNLHKGLLFTIREVLIRPGASVRKFIHQDRNHLVKPIVFVIITSLIYSFSQQWLNFEDGYMNYSFGEGSASTALFVWLSGHYGYANIMMAFFIALWIKLFYRKYNYNFFEILILLCYVMGGSMLIFSFFGLLQVWGPLKILDKGFLIGVLYAAWGIARFFDPVKKINYLKGILSYMLGMITFVFVALCLGGVLDWVIPLL